MRRLAQFVRLLASRVSRLSASVHVKGSECVRLRLASRVCLSASRVCICLASRVCLASASVSRLHLSACVCSRLASVCLHLSASVCLRLFTSRVPNACVCVLCVGRLVSRLSRVCASCASVVLSRVCLASVVLSRVCLSL